MKTNDEDHVLMIRYLLGDLPEAERERLEQRFFADDDYYGQLLALENELTYDYAQGRLAPAERVRFEQRFVTTPAAHLKVKQAQILLTKLAPANEQPAAAVGPPAKPAAWWQSLLDWFLAQTPFLRFAFVATGLALALGFSWLILETVRLRVQLGQLRAERMAQERTLAEQAAALEREQTRRAALEQELGHREQQLDSLLPLPTPQAPNPALISITLLPGLQRDLAGPKELRLSTGTERIQFQLRLRERADYQAYRAVLQTVDGQELWQQPNLRPKRSAAGLAVTLRAPTRILPAGDYQILLHGTTASGSSEEVGDYYFTVVKE